MEGPAVIADPVVIWDLVDTVAPLMHWYIASSTKEDQVFVLVVAVVADGALSVFLDDEAPLVCAERVVALDVETVRTFTVGVVGPLGELLKNALVILIVLLLLPLLHVAQEFFFLLRRVAHIQQHFVLVLHVPLVVLLYIRHEVRVHKAQEVQAVVAELCRIVW